jgi:hypothetical protein
MAEKSKVGSHPVQAEVDIIAQKCTSMIGSAVSYSRSPSSGRWKSIRQSLLDISDMQYEVSNPATWDLHSIGGTLRSSYGPTGTLTPNNIEEKTKYFQRIYLVASSVSAVS